MRKKFKLNWGHKLMLVFASFALLMFYLAFRSFQTKVDLVDRDYYKDELRYQEIIDRTEMANQLSGKVIIRKSMDRSILVQLPAEMVNKPVTGNIWFYCASDASKDRHIELVPGNDASQLIRAGLLPAGRYVVKIKWDCDHKQYYAEENFTL
jgi:hypothetical protein